MNLNAFDKALAEANREVNALYQVSQDGESLLALYEKLTDRETLVSSMLTTLRGLVATIGIEKAARYAASERFYVYVSRQYDKEIEPSLDSLAKASANCWHNLKFAAGNWKRMEDLNTDRKRKSSETRYWIMAYDPVSGRIRKLTQEEILGAAALNFKESK